MDTLGLLIVVLITGANVDDGTATSEVLAQMFQEDFPRLETIFGDNKYHNKKLEAWLKKDRPQWNVEVNRPPEDAIGFQPVRIRWVIERSNA